MKKKLIGFLLGSEPIMFACLSGHMVLCLDCKPLLASLFVLAYLMWGFLCYLSGTEDAAQGILHKAKEIMDKDKRGE